MSLQDQIFSKFAKSKLGYEKEEMYLPEGCIDELITETEIKKELQNSTMAPEQKMLVNFIEQKAKKVFAITILASLRDDELYQAMKQFHKCDFDDAILPVANIEENPIARIRDAFSDDRLWGEWRKHSFKEKQWMFLVPVFTQQQPRYDLARSCILPFKCVSSQTKGGTFGDVFEVEIHESHQKGDVFMVNGKRANVAVKEIVARETDKSTFDDIKKLWDTEEEALNKTSEVQHENLIQCIAAITRGEKYYFLFPWADGGSLREFWKNVPNPILTPDFVKEIIEQLFGLAEALDGMHTYQDRVAILRQDTELGNAGKEVNPDSSHGSASESGGIRHGDLKPENILRFTFGDSNGIGTLKIADMGLAKHHKVITTLRKNLTTTKYGTARYEPPEVRAPRLTTIPATSRLYDIWSTGCIILELIIWLLYGYEELVAFYNLIRGDSILHVDPPYYIIKDAVEQRKVAEVHPIVAHCIAHLSKDKACAEHTALGDLLRTVEKKLLVVTLPPSRTTTVNENISITLAPSTEPNAGEYRATARILCKALRKILGKAQNDVGYLDVGRDPTGIRGLSRVLKAALPGHLRPDSAEELGERSKEASTTELSPVSATQMKGSVSKTFFVNILASLMTLIAD